MRTCSTDLLNQLNSDHSQVQTNTTNISTLTTATSLLDDRVTDLEGSTASAAKTGLVNVDAINGSRLASGVWVNALGESSNTGTSGTVSIKHDSGSLLNATGNCSDNDVYLLVPSSGILIINAGMAWSAFGNNYRQLAIKEWTNATTYAELDFDMSIFAETLAKQCYLQITGILKVGTATGEVDPGKKIAIYGYQNSGTSLTKFAAEKNYLSYIWLP